MKRKENENFEDYKKRRKAEQIALKKRLRGVIIWNQGAYNKKTTRG